jgi:hypothetical protein
VDGRSATATISFSVGVPAAPSGSYASGAVGETYASGPLQTNGGVAPFRWSIASGSLPPGLSSNPTTGTISGVPTTAGSYSFSVTTTDARSITSAASPQTITIAAGLAISGMQLVEGATSTPFSYQPTVTGGGGGNVFSVTNADRSLAAFGLSLNTTTGEISGVPDVADSWGGRLVVVNAAGITKSMPLTISIVSGVPSNVTSWGSYLTGDGKPYGPHSTPFKVVGGQNYIKLAAGQRTMCGFLSDGTAQCWNYTDYTIPGRGQPRVPVRAPLLDGASDTVSNMQNTCAIFAGAAKCWGNNRSSQIGDGTTTDRAAPAQVSGLTSNVTQVAVSRFGSGFNSACAVQAGALKCWGTIISDGTKSATPVTVIASGVQKISIGLDHMCAVVSGAAKCWGNNANGQLGDGTKTMKTTPTQVSGLTSGVTDISAGQSFTCAIQNGSAKCWGKADPYLGDGSSSTTDRTSPTQVQGIASGATQIVAADGSVCALVSGAVKCWGYNYIGDLGNGSEPGAKAYSPVQVIGLETGVSELVGGGAFLAR